MKMDGLHGLGGCHPLCKRSDRVIPQAIKAGDALSIFIEPVVKPEEYVRALGIVLVTVSFS